MSGKAGKHKIKHLTILLPKIHILFILIDQLMGKLKI